MENTPRSLLDKIRTQPSDQLAWEKLLDIYRPWVTGWLLRQSIPREDIEDVLQDAMIYLHKQLPLFAHNGNTGAFRRWLRQVIFNRLCDIRRKRRDKTNWPQELDEQICQFADSSSDLTKMWDLEHDRFVLQGLLASIANDFSPKSWEVFRRYVFDRQPATQIASELEITVGNVFAIKSRFVRRLREVAKDVYPELDY